MTDGRQKLDDQRGLAQAIVDTVREPLLVLDGALRVVAASRAFYTVFRVQASDTIGLPVYALGDGQWQIPALRTLLERLASDHSSIEGFEVTHDFAGIGLRVMLLNARRVFHQDGSGSSLLLAFEDVTALRAAEAERRVLVFATAERPRQKDLLVEEMQHRVANSLQIIAGILMRKARTVTSEETRGHLQDAQRRILSLAAVQAQLRTSGRGERVEVGPYLANLCASLTASMIGDDGTVALDVVAGPGSMNSAEAVSLGLIVTEVVINALKHAFPAATSDARVTIRFEAGPRYWTLRVNDNGVGLPDSPQPPGKGGLGKSLMHALADSLGARIEVASSPAGLGITVRHGTERLALPVAA